MTSLLLEAEKLRKPLLEKPEFKKWEMFVDGDYCLDEPPAWHQAIAEERYQAWTEGKIASQDLDEAIKELKAELGIEE